MSRGCFIKSFSLDIIGTFDVLFGEEKSWDDHDEGICADELIASWAHALHVGLRKNLYVSTMSQLQSNPTA